MTAAVRMGDANSAGGVINNIPQGSVYINNKLASVVGSKGTGHPPCPNPSIHCSQAWSTVPTTNNVYFENKLAIQVGDVDTCGHSRSNGSPDTFIN